MSQRTVDVENLSTTLSVLGDTVQDGIGVVLQLYTRELINQLSMPSQLA